MDLLLRSSPLRPDPTAADELLFPVRPSRRSNILWLASAALFYFAVARFSELLAFEPEDITAICPAAGVFLSAILLTRRNLRLWLIGLLWATDLGAGLSAGTPFSLSFLDASAMTGEAVLSAWLLGRFVRGPSNLNLVHNLLGWLILSVCFSSMVTAAFLAGATNLLLGVHSFWKSWQEWATSDGVGNLLATPFLLSWAAWGRQVRTSTLRRQRIVEWAAMVVSIMLLNFVLFRQWSGHPLFALFLPYLTLPFLSWAAWRFGVRGVATVMVVLAAIAVPFTAAGRIPSFSSAAGSMDVILVVQLILAISAMPMLYLAAVLSERQRAQAALREGEKRYRILFEQAAVAVAQVETATGRFVRVNQRYCDLVGYTPAEMLALNFQTITHPDDLAPDLGHMARLNAGEIREFRMEKRYIQKDGQVVWVNLNVSAMWAPGEPPTFQIAVAEDITERKKAAAELAQREAQFRAIFDQAPVGISLTTGSGYHLVNAEHVRITGVPVAQANVPGIYARVSHPEDYVLQQEATAKFIKGKTDHLKVEKRFLHPGGRVQWAELTSRFFTDPSTGARRIVSVLTDIGARKQAEEAQRASEERHRTIVHTAMDGFWRVDLRGRFIEVSETACRMLGYSEPELLAMGVPDVSTVETAADTAAHIQKIIMQGSDRFESRHRRKDGSTFPVEISAQYHASEGGNLVVFMRDITKRQQALANQQLAADVLRLLNQPGDLATLAKELVELIRCALAVDAIGLRLRQNGDFPYFVQQGFSETFVRMENSLCAKNALGGVLRDVGGQPVLECTCGLVLSGRADPSLPGCTTGGSCWTNDASAFLHLTPEQDPRTHPRNHCIYAGFESVALIPLRSGGEIIGLLQLNDRRSGRFSPGLISFLEGLAASIGIALHREQAAAALRESEKRLEDITFSLADWVWEVNENGRYTHSSQQGFSYFGPAREDVIGKTPFDFMPPDEAKRVGAIFADFAARKAPIKDLENWNITKSGERICFLTNGVPILGEAGNLKGYRGVDKDITPRKRVEEQLRKQAALLDAATDAIYVRDLDHTVTYWNGGAERLFGVPRADAVGRKITELGGKDHAAFDAAHAKLLAQGAWSGELMKPGGDGTERTVFCRWTLLRDEQGRPSEVLAINTDVTEKKQLEHQFLRAQRMEGIGLLAGGIAHDLNNILTPVMMTASLLRESVRDAESYQLLDSMQTSAKRGADIIRQLLTFARGEPEVFAPVPVRQLMGEMEKIIRETFPRNLRQTIVAPLDLWPVVGDPTQIHQALLNLCVNARDAMPEGGTLTLTAANLTLDVKSASLIPVAQPGHFVCVSVIDTGMGIPPAELEQIFDPFFTTKEVGKGTGLGLPSVLGIMRGHGGFVRVDSHVGRGSTFELYFPALPKAKTAAAPERVAPPHGLGELILVVDDEVSVRGATKSVLEQYGYRVLAAADGAEALKLFDQHRAEIKAVLTDMMMPGMDGPALVRALRPRHACPPLLGMTGLTDRANLKELPGLGLPELLPKPFSVEQLLVAVHTALAAARPPAA